MAQGARDRTRSAVCALQAEGKREGVSPGAVPAERWAPARAGRGDARWPGPFASALLRQADAASSQCVTAPRGLSDGRASASGPRPQLPPLLPQSRCRARSPARRPAPGEPEAGRGAAEGGRHRGYGPSRAWGPAEGRTVRLRGRGHGTSAPRPHVSCREHSERHRVLRPRALEDGDYSQVPHPITSWFPLRPAPRKHVRQGSSGFPHGAFWDRRDTGFRMAPSHPAFFEIRATLAPRVSSRIFVPCCLITHVQPMCSLCSAEWPTPETDGRDLPCWVPEPVLGQSCARRQAPSDSSPARTLCKGQVLLVNPSCPSEPQAAQFLRICSAFEDLLAGD